MRFSKRIRGFSLIELLLALMLAALLYEAVLYSFGSFLKRTSNENVLEELLGAIQFARQEALLRHVGVGICKSNNQRACSEDGEEGLIVFIDPSEAGYLQDETEILQVFRFAAGESQGHLKWRAFPRYLRHLQFLPSGATQQQNGSFWYCPEHSALPVWTVMLSKSGRWQVVYPDKKGNIIDERGKLFSC